MSESKKRDTLAKIVEEIRAYGSRPPPRLMWLEIADRIEALSEPARNCDMYATYAEAAEAHKEYATAYIMRASNKFDSPMEFDEWLLAPAAERKGATA